MAAIGLMRERGISSEGTPREIAVGGLDGKDGRLAVLSQRAESGLGLGGIAVLSPKNPWTFGLGVRSREIQYGEGRTPKTQAPQRPRGGWRRAFAVSAIAPKRVTEVACRRSWGCVVQGT